jgi:hypothetical protein
MKVLKFIGGAVLAILVLLVALYLDHNGHIDLRGMSHNYGQ